MSILFIFSLRVQKHSDLNTFEKEFKTSCSNIIHIFTLRESYISNVQFIIKLFIIPMYSYILSNNAHKSDSICVHFLISHDFKCKSWDFPDSSADKESACNAEDPNSIPGPGRSPGEGIDYPLQYSWAFLVIQTVKNPPTIQETWVWSLNWEDPLEKGKATHSSILASRIPWTV